MYSQPGLLQKQYLLQKRDIDLNFLNVRKCKTCIVIKVVRGFMKKAKTVLILENKFMITFVDLVMFKKMIAIFIFIDICTPPRKNPKIFIS